MDIMILIIGLLALLFIIVKDIMNFRKHIYEPKILSSRDGQTLIAYIICLLPILFVQDSILKAVFALVLISALILDKTTLNIALLKSNKVKFNMLETVVFDTVFVLFGVLIIVKFLL